GHVLDATRDAGLPRCSGCERARGEAGSAAEQPGRRRRPRGRSDGGAQTTARENPPARGLERTHSRRAAAPGGNGTTVPRTAGARRAVARAVLHLPGRRGPVQAMSQPSRGVPPYRVVYSGLCRDSTRQLLARAAAKGRSAEVAQVVRDVHTRLEWIPLDFGEP